MGQRLEFQWVCVEVVKMDNYWVVWKDENLESPTAVKMVVVLVINLVVLKAYELDDFWAEY